eukprot:scaffold6621_cov82-Cyclotella_meneghiniana.AAC.2
MIPSPPPTPMLSNTRTKERPKGNTTVAALDQAVMQMPPPKPTIAQTTRTGTSRAMFAALRRALFAALRRAQRNTSSKARHNQKAKWNQRKTKYDNPN